jgi:uncharacterized membrane protein
MSTSAKVVSRETGTVDGVKRFSAVASWPLAVAIVLSLFYLGTSLYIATQRLFWFDELFTIHIARLPHLSTIWTAMANGVDALPPPYYILVRAFDSLFGPSEMSARLPSALAMGAGLLIIFDCTRRLTDGLHGLLAFGVATSSFLLYYGYEARSYAIYFMLAALALWLWHFDGVSARTQTILFGGVFFLGGCFHYYFMMCLAPYALWELLRWTRGQRPPAKLIAGFVGCALSLLVLSPFILSFSHKFGGGYWNRPTLKELLAMYMQMFPDGMFLLAIIALWIAVVRSVATTQEETLVPAMPPAETIGWLFLGVPLAAYIVAVAKTNAFFSRYFIGVLPGVAVAFAVMMWRHFRGKRRVSLVVVLLLLGWGVAQQLIVANHIDKVEATGIRSLLEFESQLHVEGRKYFVFTAPMLYLDSHQYSAHPDDSVLLLPSDFSHKPLFGPDLYQHQRLEVNLSQYYPLQFWTIEELRRHHSQVAVISPDEQALNDMQREGIHLRARSSNPIKVFYPE